MREPAAERRSRGSGALLLRHLKRCGLAVVVAVLAITNACGEADTQPSEPARDVGYFLDRLHELDDLPALGLGSSELASTWDRAGGNALDGETYVGIDGDHNVLLDVDGPGVIHRISTGVIDEALLDTSLELWLDGERVVAIPAAQLFDPSASPFAGPLVHDGAYPTVRMPIPFAEHAQLRLISASHDWGLFWQVAYSRFATAIPVETLALPLAADAQASFDRAGEAWLDSLVGIHGPSSEPTVVESASLEPGQSLSWSGHGCGTIERLELTIDPNWAAAWRGLIVRITWDDAALPAIDLPAHQLWVGADYNDDPLAVFDSLVLGAEDGRAYLRLPMPYRNAARIELHNTAVFEFEVELGVWIRACDRQPDEYGYLHASAVTTAAATDDSPVAGPEQLPVHRLFDHAGRGKLVGTGLRLYWPYPDLWWGEGDWQIWADRDVDSWPPSYHGTGTEEFYDGGWTRFDRRPLSGAVKQRPGLVTVYGFLLNDAFNFEDHLRVQVETLGLLGGHQVIVEQHPEWVTTVYWYDELAD